MEFSITFEFKNDLMSITARSKYSIIVRYIEVVIVNF